MWCCLDWRKDLFCTTKLSCCLVLAAFILPVSICPSHLAHEFILMSFLLHKVAFIHATLAAVFQLQRSKAGTDLSAQSQNTLCCRHIVAKIVCMLIMETLLAKEKPLYAGLGPVQPHVLSQHYLFLYQGSKE